MTEKPAESTAPSDEKGPNPPRADQADLEPDRRGPARRAVVMVWDGMRPDLVSPELTPNLARLAEGGVWFEASHAQFPTVTRVNAATIATGATPTTHGLPANVLYAPLVDRAALISLGEGDSVAALRRAYGVFRTRTMAAAVTEAGGRAVVVSSGTRGATLMSNPAARERGDLLLHPTLSTPAEWQPAVGRLGPLPAATVPNSAQNRWFARAIAEYVLPELGPSLLQFWHNDPDKSQHCFGFGHPESLRAIRDADEHLGIILDALDRLGLRRETVVVVASDHGYTSVRRHARLAEALVRAGLKASLDSVDVVVAPNGNAVLLYFPDGSAERRERVAAFLLEWDAAAVIFSGARGARVLDGTFPLLAVGVDGPLAPDLLVGLAWSDDANEYGHRGRSVEDGQVNRASHGGLSPWEMRNTLVMAGAGVRRGLRNTIPSGNVDIAPTLLRLLGLDIPPTVEGRVLGEALIGEDAVDQPVTRDVTVCERPTGTRRSELLWSSVAGRRYLDGGRCT